MNAPAVPEMDLSWTLRSFPIAALKASPSCDGKTAACGSSFARRHDRGTPELCRLLKLENTTIALSKQIVRATCAASLACSPGR
jgi:hypothetical protein